MGWVTQPKRQLGAGYAETVGLGMSAAVDIIDGKGCVEVKKGDMVGI